MDCIDIETRKALKAIHSFCEGRNAFVATAESVSAGMLQWLLASEENAGDFFCGGITAYTCLEKQRQFGIPQLVCDSVLGVDPDIAEQMAREVCIRFKCSMGLSLTGFANPLPEDGIYHSYAFGSMVWEGQVIFTREIDGKGKFAAEAQMEFCSALLRQAAYYLTSKPAVF